MTGIEIEKTILKAAIHKAADRNNKLHEKFNIERAKKEKQMAVAREFVIDLLASEKIVTGQEEEYSFMNKNYTWNKISDFHYEHRPLNRMSRKESVTAKFLNYKGKYTYKWYKWSHFQTF